MLAQRVARQRTRRERDGRAGDDLWCAEGQPHARVDQDEHERHALASGEWAGGLLDFEQAGGLEHLAPYYPGNGRKINSEREGREGKEGGGLTPLEVRCRPAGACCVPTSA